MAYIVEGVMQLPIPDDVHGFNPDLDDMLTASLLSDATQFDRDCMCGRKYRASRRRELVEPPIAFIIHIKRFDDNGNKNNTLVNFNSTLNIGPLFNSLSGDQRTDFLNAGGQVDEAGKPDLVYRLRAFTVHSGSSRASGHHVAYARRIYGQMQQWHKYNDGTVEPVEFESLAEERAQLLLFETDNAKAVSVLRRSVKVDIREGPSGRKPPSALLPEPDAFVDDAAAAVGTTDRDIGITGDFLLGQRTHSAGDPSSDGDADLHDDGARLGALS